MKTIKLLTAAIISMYILFSFACKKKTESDELVDFQINLENLSNSDLNDNGGYIYALNVIIARQDSLTYYALDKNCPDDEFEITFNYAAQLFFCQQSGSAFNLQGDQVIGEGDGVKSYQTELIGSVLRVYED